MSDPFFEQIRARLIVSCQALEDEPLHGSDVMAKMAKAAEIGGAAAIRANGADDVRAIRQAVPLPVIGLVKRNYPDSEIYITSTRREVDELIEAGASMIAFDATRRPRPSGETLESLIAYMHSRGVKMMADISTLEESAYAASLGVDCVSTTLSGYTPYSPQDPGPDLQLIREAVRALSIPVIAEGKIWDPSQAVQALEAGAYAVVVGSAITRPQLIAERYASAIRRAAKAAQPAEQACNEGPRAHS
ncbi:N-acetylmannosamine-6-phosphate 2-epimerase [Paenibacillus allorhizosphaerae]|uniref:Putative N-acetylmannosamine-6-phosphate 2-epimerase n=1 Tax=Paenibacillus allorhizosphaerae TaxID=2849866 RepID=A0ABM8VT02_9BACL|nr:N-acetylmannosamine-6-phosphate 2-epimerase [Paenibacillus allorhizosphaerae]CAG7657200.1 Putative N-acetylmannosamine-6-phosphate 2-epimerase [Paenibacillus allorhizosphaerae]